MKSATSAMDTLLTSGNSFFTADVYRFDTKSGTAFQFTDADIDLDVPPYGSYVSKKVILERTKTRQVLGIEASTMTIKMSSDNVYTMGGKPFLKALRSGYFDGAYVNVSKLFTADVNNITEGTINIFSGEVQNVEVSGLTAIITVVSDAYKLDTPFPKNTYQPSCSNTLYDGLCTAVKSSFSATGTATGGTNTSVTSALSNASGYFDLGTIKFTSGANNGLIRTVKSFYAGGFTLYQPLPLPPSSGDTFIAYAGCDKTLSTCQSKFSNGNNFRGFPWIPSPETIA